MSTIDPTRLVRFMAHFFDNCTTEVLFHEKIQGYEDRVLADFQACTAAVDSSEFIRAAHACAYRLNTEQQQR